MPAWFLPYLIILVLITYLLLYTEAGDLLQKENLIKFGLSILIVLLSYGLATVIVPVAKSEPELKIIIATSKN